MVTGLHLSFSLFVVLAIFYGMHFFLVRKYDPFRGKGSSGAVNYTITGLIVSILLILQPAVLPILSLYTDASWGMNIQIIGLLLFFSSLLLHWWARSSLPQFFSERIEVQKGRHSIKSGPYAYIPYPIYTSFFIFGLGLLLLNPSLPVLLILVYIFWNYARLASKEEDLVGNNIPGYQEYIGRTSRFLPVSDKRPKERNNS